MYARKVSLCLKSESTSQFLHEVEHEVVPLLRKQKGFLDQLTLFSLTGKIVYVYTFWEDREHADKYDCTSSGPLLFRLTLMRHFAELKFA